MSKQIRLILILVIVISSSQAQVIDTIGYGSGFLRGEKHLISSPTRIKKKDVLPVIVIGLSGTALFFADEFIQEETQLYRHQHKLDNVASTVTHLGDPITLIILPLSGFTIGKITNNERFTHASEIAGLSVIHSAVISLGIKALTGRKRPNESDNSFEWSGPSTEFWSFPSFHAAGSWALATSIARSYPEKKWLGVTCYSIATGVSLSRVYLDKHWSSDVFWGAALGFGIGSSMVKFHENDRFTFSPFFGTRTGVSLRIKI